MNDVVTEERVAAQQRAATPGAGELASVKPLPVWFFAFEGALGAAYDLCHAWSGAWMVIAALGVVNLVVGFTVMRRRVKLMRALLKNSRTRKIALGLIALRLSAHMVLGVLGAQVTTVAGHLVLASVMAGATVTLLWFDQRTAFRALGVAPAATR